MNRQQADTEITRILLELEKALWEIESRTTTVPTFSLDAFRASIKIFVSLLTQYVWQLQENEELDMDIRLDMVEKAGTELRKLVKVYTGVDTVELNKEFFEN